MYVFNLNIPLLWRSSIPHLAYLVRDQGANLSLIPGGQVWFLTWLFPSAILWCESLQVAGLISSDLKMLRFNFKNYNNLWRQLVCEGRTCHNRSAVLLWNRLFLHSLGFAHSFFIYVNWRLFSFFDVLSHSYLDVGRRFMWIWGTTWWHPLVGQWAYLYKELPLPAGHWQITNFINGF